jgi:hypothetical protein
MKLFGGRKTSYWQLFLSSFLLSVIVITSYAQSQLPKGSFLQDSVQVGHVISFSFSYLHPAEATVFFPDTAYNFSPFELVKRDIFPTSTDESGSLDSVIYFLKTFTIEPHLTLSLPIFLISEADSNVSFSNVDTVQITQLIAKEALDAGIPETDFSTIKTKKPFDYWTYAKYLLLITAAWGSIYLLFGNYIYRRYRLLIYRKRHRDFVAKFKRYIKDSDTSQNVNQALILWKKHLQDLEDVPFTTLTTKEIVEAIPNERLGEALRTMDMNIYGEVQSSQMIFAMSKLLDIANERYLENRKTYETKLKEKNK